MGLQPQSGGGGVEIRDIVILVLQLSRNLLLMVRTHTVLLGGE